jgi:hypothetical protein
MLIWSLKFNQPNGSLMKRFILILAVSLISLSLFAQVQTVVTGKVLNKPGKKVILLVYNFNTATLSEEETTLVTDINPDSTFTFSTDLIVRPFTSCRLGFSNEGMKIQLSPGDSLQTEFIYGAMDTTSVFGGKPSGINAYLNKYQLEFPEARRNEILRSHDFRDSLLFQSWTGLRNSKLAFLNTIDSLETLDPSFVQLEISRINYEYYADLVNPAGFEYSDESDYRNRVTDVLSKVDLSDHNALLNFRIYRQFLMDYVDYRMNSMRSRVTLQNRLDLINTELQGLTGSYCSYSLIKNVISSVRSNQKKLVLRDYFLNRTHDANLAAALQSLALPTQGKNSKDYRIIVNTVQEFMVVVAFLALLVSVLYLLRNFLLKRKVQINPLRMVRLVIYLLIGFLVVVIVGNGKLYGVFLVLAFFLFIGLQLFWLIPRWFVTKRYTGYSLLMGVVSVVFFGLLVLLSKNLNWNTRPDSLHVALEESIQMFIVSWILLVPFAFFNYYLNLLIKRGRGFQHLFKENLVNPEVLAHVVFLMIALLTLFINAFRYQSQITTSLIIVLGLIIFYAQTFRLIPRFLMKRKFLRYIAGWAGLVVGTAVFLYGMGIIEMYRTISNLGINIRVRELMIPYDQILVITAIALQVVVIPAGFYVFVKRQLAEKSTGFKLFRNKEAELQQLRSQVNPHFLFNSLNTLYAFALKENHSKTAEYIAKLANLMRYLVDDMEKDLIPVQKEISYIRDYINLQAIRSSVEHKIEICDEIGEDQNLLIAPMLMIPFVENAFKHGINPNSVSELKVNFLVNDDQYQFVIDNSIDKNFEAFYKEKGFGIGIENVRQRLAHLYPGKHTLSIANTGERFIVILTIALPAYGNIA